MSEKDAKLKEIPSVAELDMRDYFAAKAMQGVIASLAPGEDYDEDRGANWAYKVADAMLRERAK